jgi:hypothetical protein
MPCELRFAHVENDELASLPKSLTHLRNLKSLLKMTREGHEPSV